MLFNFLLGLLMLDGLVLTGVVLLQSGQGGGLASLGGGTASQVLGGRQATTIATKATWVTGGIFMFLALVLSTMSRSRVTGSTSEVQKNLLQNAPPVAPPASPTGGGDAVGNLLNGTTTNPGTTAAPPATGTTPPPAAGTTTPPAAGGAGGKPEPAPAPVKKP